MYVYICAQLWVCILRNSVYSFFQIWNCKNTLQCLLTDQFLKNEKKFEPRHDKTNKVRVRPAKTQISLGIRMRKASVLSYPFSAQRRLWSDWADAQADRSLHRPHSHFVGFIMSRLIFKQWKEICQLVIVKFDVLNDIRRVKISINANVKINWAASWQNQQNGMRAQRRLRSAWASAQSDQSLRCALNG